MSFLNPILAQAAAPNEVTVGTVLTAIMFLMTAVGSMAMIVAWVIRYGQTGHALPAARRGVLRVPWPLTLVAVALSVLLMALVLTSSLVDPVPVVNNVVPAKPADNITKVTSSRDLATCPSSRAFSRRPGEAGSVFSRSLSSAIQTPDLPAQERLVAWIIESKGLNRYMKQAAIGPVIWSIAVASTKLQPFP